MKEREYILELYEVYKNVLTEKERTYFEYYYFEDYSLQEIADNYSVSKSYVGKYLNSIEDKIINYEKELKVLEKNNKIKEIIKDLDDNSRARIEELL